MRFLSFVFCVAAALPTFAADEIALKEIWAYNMPGTRDVRELPAAKKDGKLIDSIRQLLKPDLNLKQARTGFVLPGSIDDAILRIPKILSSKNDPLSRFHAGDDLTLVFFSYESPFYVHVKEVQRKGNAIRISYQFVPHESADTTQHFALIPVGQLPAGKYSVRVEPEPMDKKYTDVGFIPPSAADSERIVSRTFYFVVSD